MKTNLLLTTALIAALSASSAFAMDGKDGRYDRERSDRSGHHSMKGDDKRGNKMFSQEEMNRVFTAEQIRTLNEARLIMKGNPNLKVGNVTATDNGYRVTIVTRDNSLVEERDVAKNNMPLKRYNAIQTKMASKQQQ